MSPVDLMDRLERMIPLHYPMLIKGAPGVGKSDIVAQACKRVKARLILSHPVVSDPTDYKGLPAIVDGHARFLPFGDLEELIDAEGLTVFFLDDLGQAPAVVQAAAMQLILARRVNGHTVSDAVTFIAATNRRQDRAGVTGILEPVKSRFMSIIELTPTPGDWDRWALANGIAPEAVAFNRFRPDLMLHPGEPTQEIINRPCPRTITNMARLYAAGITDLETLGGAVGEGYAAEFLGFVKLYQSLPSIDGILLSPERAAVPTEPAALYAIATVLANRCTKDNCGRVLKYLNRLPEEFSVLGVRDIQRTCPSAANTPEFIRWVVDHQNVLM